jgi:hypothetical protein
MEHYNLVPANRSENQKNLQTASPAARLAMDNLPADLKHELFIAAELYTLRMAYPVQARNFSEREVLRTNELWAEIFSGVDLRLMHKAIIRFIAIDRKAFFPSPGQIIGVVEDILAEEAAEEKRLANERHIAYLRELQTRIDSGENCSTCRFCEHRQEKLFCRNRDSYKYDEHYRFGTAASILCELYEPMPLLGGDNFCRD